MLLVDDAPSVFAAAENVQVSADKHSSYSALCSPREKLIFWVKSLCTGLTGVYHHLGGSQLHTTSVKSGGCLV